MNHSQFQKDSEALDFDSEDTALHPYDNWMQNLWKWADENDIDDHCIPRNKKELLQLTELDLSLKKLFHIPKEIGNLINLSILNVSHNNLIGLPKEIGNLTNLTKLELEYNYFERLPKNITKLTSLQILDLSNNQLTKLPKEIGRLVNLSKLYLRGNKLVELPNEIINMTNLTTLNVEDNKYLKYISKKILNHVEAQGYRSRILRLLLVLAIAAVSIIVVMLASCIFAAISTIYQVGEPYEATYTVNAAIAFGHITGAIVTLTALFYLFGTHHERLLNIERIDTKHATSINDLNDALNEYSNKYFNNRFADFLGFFSFFVMAIFVIVFLADLALIWYTGVYDLNYAPLAWLMDLIPAIAHIIEVVLNYVCYLITGNQLGEPSSMRKYLKKRIAYIEAGNS